MSEWQKVPFGSLFLVPTRNGIYKTAEFHGRGTKIVNMGELFANDRIGKQSMERIELSEQEKKVSLLEIGDLLFARRSLVESGAGKAAIVTELPEETTFESSVIRVRLDQEKCNPLFYLYWLRSYNGRSAIMPLVTGVNVKGIRGSELATIIVDYPSIDIQNRITSALSVYDDLIENNQRQIKLLEEAAQRLYKEWFVDLRYPGHENVPVVDGTPEGWATKTIANIASVNCDSIGKDWPYNTIDYIDISSVAHGQIESKTTSEIKDAPGRARRLAHDGDIIWSMVRPNLRAYALIQYPDEKDVFSTGFAVLSARKVPFTFLYCFVTTDDFVGYLVNCTNGAAYPAVKPIHFEKAEITVPSVNVLQNFEKLTLPLFRKIHLLSCENKCLSETRDRLLPKLMSGEIAV